MSTSLAVQAFSACVASVAIYVSNNDPSGSMDKPPNGPTPAGQQQEADRIYKFKDSQALVRKVEYFLYIKGSAISAAAQGFYLLKLFLDTKGAQAIRPTHARPSSAHLGLITPFYISAIFAGAIRFWCYRTLKHYFTFRLQVQDKQQLVQTGPYRYLAHPSYFGLFFAYLSMATVLLGPLNVLVYLLDDAPLLSSATLALPSWLSRSTWGLNSVSLTPRTIARTLLSLEAFQVVRTAFWITPTRISDEETMMLKHFGQQYEEYLARRWRVFPFIW